MQICWQNLETFPYHTYTVQWQVNFRVSFLYNLPYIITSQAVKHHCEFDVLVLNNIFELIEKVNFSNLLKKNLKIVYQFINYQKPCQKVWIN